MPASAPPPSESRDVSLSFEVVARALRNGQTEDWHHGAAAVVTPAGELKGRIGDPQLPVFLRSAAKPFQAVELVLAGGCERYSLEPADLALICASHVGTPAHEERAASILARAELTEDDLRCGIHPPFDAEVRRAMRARGEEPRVLQNNCSGKHAGMLCACRLLGLPLESYLEPEHPLQLRIRDQIARFSAVDAEQIGVGIDGCSLPTFSLPLAAAARAYAALADPEAADLPGDVAAAVRRIVDAMTSVPEMVAGPGHFSTRLMEVTGGRILGKEGAQGYYAVAVRGPVALGITVKVAGGDQACRPGVVLDLLRQAGVLSAAELAELESFWKIEIRNYRGLEVGELKPDLELENV